MKELHGADRKPGKKSAPKKGANVNGGTEKGHDRDERALWENDRFYYAFFDLAPDPMAITDIDNGQLVDVNQAFVDWSCYSRDALIGRTTTELSIWVDNEARDEVIDELEHSGSVENIEVNLRRGNGELRQIMLSGKFIEIGGKKYLLSVARDVTERKRVQEALKESEERFRDLFDNAVEGVYHTTPEGRLANANMAFARMFGYGDPEEAVGSITDIARQLYVDPDDRRKVLGFLMEKGYLDNFECPMRRKDGSVFWVVMNARSTCLRDGTTCFEGFITDITDRKNAEEERERLIVELKEALSRVKTLSGLLPICASCKKIRNDKGYWEQMEMYIRDHSEAEFSHGICPECAEKLYPQLNKKK